MKRVRPLGSERQTPPAVMGVKVDTRRSANAPGLVDYHNSGGARTAYAADVPLDEATDLFFYERTRRDRDVELDSDYYDELIQAFPQITAGELHLASVGGMSTFPSESDWTEERLVFWNERSVLWD